MMEAVLSNADHPEYGVATIPLPIPRNQYDHCVSLLEALEIGGASEADCRLDSLDSAWPVLNRLVCTKVNLDELDYLAKRLDSFTVGEFSQFQAMAEKLNLASMKDLINLTFCCQQATVITDFTNLKEIGRDHYMNIHGGCASMEELEQLDGAETAILLIEDNEGTVTRYGVVYDNGMQLSQLYDGKHLPCYHYEADMTAVGISTRWEPENSRNVTWIYLPASKGQIERAMQRSGIADPKDMRLFIADSSFPEEVDVTALVDSDDIHCLMIGASGIGKTAYFLYPNLEYACASGMSWLALDSKGDLARNYGAIAKNCYGYQNVAVIDLRNPTRSDGNNLLTLVNRYMDIARSDPNNLAARAKAEKYAKILSKTIVNPDGDDSNRGQNAFFYDAAEGLLTSVILMLAEFLPPDKDHPQERRHIVSVFKLVQDLLEPSRVKGKSHFQLLMAKLPPDHKARWFAGAALNSAEQAMASVMSTVLSRLNAFLDSELEQILCFDSAIDAEKFASEKSAIFLILPEEDTTKNFMAGLMIQNLSRELFAVADENGGKLKNRVVLFCDEFGTMPPFDILPLFSAGRSRRLTLVPIIQSLAQLEKNYGKEGCEIIQDNCQDTIFGGFAPNSQTAEVLSKALGSRTVLSGSVSRGKNDPSQSLQMMERALLTPDELKSIPKGSFIVMKTGTHPMRTRLQLFLNWGITFGEPYVVPERANRAVAYANRVDLDRNLPQLSEPEEMDESRGYAVSSRGGIAHAPAQERAVKRGKQMKTFGEEER